MSLATHQPLRQDDPDVDVEGQPLQLKEYGNSSPPAANGASPKLDSNAAVPLEDSISMQYKLVQLSMYFLCNISLTIYNKLILGKFPHPWLLTALHAGSASIGCYILRMRGSIPRSDLDRRQSAKLIALSVLFTVNIAISNVSLALVSVPFHQVVRSTTPVVTVAIYRFVYGRGYSRETYLSLIPIVLGVGMTTYGEYYFTMAGFLLTNLGVVLAAVKTIATNRIMTGSLKMSPLETLMRMSPLAFFQALFVAWVSGELSRAWNAAMAVSVPVDASGNPPAGVAPSEDLLGLAAALLGNGILAFALNVCSFTTNKAVGALTMTVCGNVKQCLTVLLGISLFNVTVGVTNGLGMVVSLVGAAWYSAVELRAKSPPKLSPAEFQKP